MSDLTVVPAGHKYAVLAVRVDNLVPSGELHRHDVGDLRVLLEAPLDLSSQWQEWLGTFRAREVADANLYLITTTRSEAPGSLDHENLALTKALDRFYRALLMTVPYIGHPQATMMTGVRAGYALDVRRVETFAGVYCAPGCHGAELGRSDLRDALHVAAGIKALQGGGEHSRVWRVINAFYAGLKAPRAGERVHEFMRCIEGFVFPAIGKTRKQVVHRSSLFVDPPQAGAVGLLFDIRSSVEHLHGPFAETSGADLNQNNVALAERAYEAEVIARHCLRTLFSRARLWPHFKDDDTLGSFWAGDETERRSLWGPALDWAGAISRFDRNRAAMVMSSS